MDKWKRKETDIGKVEIQTDQMSEDTPQTEIQTDQMCEDTPHTEMSARVLPWWWLCGIFKSLKK